ESAPLIVGRQPEIPRADALTPSGGREGEAVGRRRPEKDRVIGLCGAESPLEDALGVGAAQVARRAAGVAAGVGRALDEDRPGLERQIAYRLAGGQVDGPDKQLVGATLDRERV